MEESSFHISFDDKEYAYEGDSYNRIVSRPTINLTGSLYEGGTKEKGEKEIERLSMLNRGRKQDAL